MGVDSVNSLLLVIVLGIAVSVALRAWDDAQDKAHNAATAVNVGLVREAVERYAADHGDDLPAKERWVAEVSALLPKHRFPVSPWGGVAQAGALGVPHAETPLPGARAVGGGAKLPEPGTRLGEGHEAKEATRFDGRTYGAILYDVDPAARVAVLYAVGKHRKEAVVAAAMKVGPVTRR